MRPPTASAESGISTSGEVGWSKYPARCTTSMMGTPSRNRFVGYRARWISDMQHTKCPSHGRSALGGPHRDAMTSTVEHRFDNGIAGNQALRTSRATNVSAFSYVGYSHAEPLSQNDRVEAPSSVTSRRSRSVPGRNAGQKVPSWKRTPTQSPSGGQSTGVALVSGPRTVRKARP